MATSRRGLAFGHLVLLLAVRGPIHSKQGRQWLKGLGFGDKTIDNAALLTGQSHGARVWSLDGFRWPAGFSAEQVAHARWMRERAQASPFQRGVYRRVRTGGTAYGGRSKRALMGGTSKVGTEGHSKPPTQMHLHKPNRRSNSCR